MNKTFLGIAALLLQIGLGLAPIWLIKAALETKAGLGKLTGKLNGAGTSLTGKARKRAQSSDFYQNREMTRQARENEIRRGNVASFAGLMSGDSRRSERARRRAAGGMAGVVFNTNAAGQSRIYQNAQDQLRRERHEEAERASKSLAQQGFEGDDDFTGIATTALGGTYTSARTGQQVQVTDAVRQAAVNNLVQQGRVSIIRGLEAAGGGRGPGGVARTDMHEVLDHAYEDYGQKLADKAPDLAPSRRASEGQAAFTDLKPEDVAAWHHSTVTAARAWYDSTTDARGAPLTAPQLAERATAREQMVRSFAEATRAPSTRSKLSLEQVTAARSAMNDAIAAGATFDPSIINDINNTYTTLGGP